MTSPSHGLTAGIANNLKRLMADQGLKTRELADLSDLGERRLSEILEARSEVGALEVMQLAAAVRAEPSDLFAGIAWVPTGKGRGEYRMIDPEGG